MILKLRASAVRGTVMGMLSLLLLIAPGCKRASEDPEAVKAALTEHLNKVAGLDMTAVEMNIVNLKFEGKEAQATVSFKSKATPEPGMTMNYTLEYQNGKWIVKRRTDSGTRKGQSGPVPVPQNDQPLPPGHPPVDKSPSGSAPK